MPARGTDDATRRLLFVAQGGNGTGEYLRLLTLAHEAERRWPDVDVTFAVRQGVPRVPDDPYPRFVLPSEPRGGALERVAWATAPDVAVLNNVGKGPDLAAVRRSGARLVFIGSVPQYRGRAFLPEMLRRMDALWLFPAEESERVMSEEEEGNWRRYGRPPVVFFDSAFAESEPERARALRERRGLHEDGYVLMVPGGGGWRPQGRPSTRLFLEAAGAVARESGLPTLAVLGPNQREDAPTPTGVTRFAYLPQPELMDLAAGARVVAAGGGGLLHQLLALGAACVATPLHVGDQKHRVAECAERGFVHASEPEPEALADAVCALLRDEPARAKLRARLAEAGPRNELSRCMELLEPLVAAGARPCPAWLRPVRPLRRR